MTQQILLDRPSAETLDFGFVEREIRRRNFGVLSTISRDGRPHGVGVLYGISRPREPFQLYVTTDRRSKKARNIGHNRNVALTVPLNRRFLRFLPPSCVQFQAIADLIPFDDEKARDAFSRSLVLRKTMELEGSQREAIFIRIRPNPILFTYGLGVSPIDLVRNIGGAARSVRIPSSLIGN